MPAPFSAPPKIPRRKALNDDKSKTTARLTQRGVLKTTFWLRELKNFTTATETRTSPNKRFNEQTMALHVRYNSLYISVLSSAKQQGV